MLFSALFQSTVSDHQAQRFLGSVCGLSALSYTQAVDSPVSPTATAAENAAEPLENAA